MPSWERIPRESTTAFTAFTCYLEMGDRRSLSSVGRKLGKSKGLMERWSSKFSWVERASLFDRHMAEVRQNAREAAEASEARQWARRRAELREDEYQLGLKLIEKAKQMLGVPVAQVKRYEEEEQLEGGQVLVKKITIIQPARWSFVDAARIIEIASKLMQLSLGLTSNITHAPWSGESESRNALATSGEEVTDEELVAIIRAGQPSRSTSHTIDEQRSAF